MAEFDGMNLKKCKEKARDEGIEHEEIAAADETQDPVEAVKQLILRKRKAVEAATRESQPSNNAAAPRGDAPPEAGLARVPSEMQTSQERQASRKDSQAVEAATGESKPPTNAAAPRGDAPPAEAGLARVRSEMQTSQERQASRTASQASTPEVDLMAEFAGMNLMALKAKAKADGIGQEEINAVDEEESPRNAVIQKILEHRKAGEAATGESEPPTGAAAPRGDASLVEASTPDVDLMAEFAGMNLKALKAKAKADGIGQEEINAVDEEDDPRNAIIQKILEHRKAGSGGYPPNMQTYVIYHGTIQSLDNDPEVMMRMPKHGKIVAQLKNGEEFEILETDDPPEMSKQCKVRLKNGMEGWVNKYDVIPLPPPASSGLDVFCSGQITPAVKKRIAELSPKSLKSSMPAFNKPRGDDQYPAGMQNYDIPCYGPQLTLAIAKLFDVKIVKERAEDMRFLLPTRNINEVIKSKNKERGRELVEEIKRAGGDEEATQRLTAFLDRLEKLGPRDLTEKGTLKKRGPRKGDAEEADGNWFDGLLHEKWAATWEENLHVDKLLLNFGFDNDFCAEMAKRIKPGKKDEPWKDYAIRWLSKAFDIFSFGGSPADVVNLIYAMLEYPPTTPNGKKPDILEVVKTVKEFTEILKNKEFHKLKWTPTYIIQDSELDDMLAWLLVCVVVDSLKGPRPFCAVQLPTAEAEEAAVQKSKKEDPEKPEKWVVPDQIKYLESQYKSRSDGLNLVTTFRDPDSRNVDKVQLSACYLPPKYFYLVSATEMRSFCGRYDWDEEESMFILSHPDTQLEQEFTSCCYLHPVSGYWVISLSTSTKNDYWQIEAMKKGCIPDLALGWRVLVEPENNPKNAYIKKKIGTNGLPEKPVYQWEEENTDGRQARWVTTGQIKKGRSPAFRFHISDDPERIPEHPPRCRHLVDSQKTGLSPDSFKMACGASAEYDGFTACGQCKRVLPEKFQGTPKCPVYQQAQQFLEELGVEQWIDHKRDHCWCPQCNNRLKPIVNDQKDEDGNLLGPYIAPQACMEDEGGKKVGPWVAFGVVIGRHLRQEGKGFKDLVKWPNTFHGLKCESLPKIFRHAQIGMPGDRLIDDYVLTSENSAGRQQLGFCTSPTVNYAGLQLYARPRISTTMPNICGQVVLQCNQKKALGFNEGDIVAVVKTQNDQEYRAGKLIGIDANFTMGDPPVYEVGKVVRKDDDGSVTVKHGAGDPTELRKDELSSINIIKAWKYRIARDEPLRVTERENEGSPTVARLSKGDIVEVFVQKESHCSGRVPIAKRKAPSAKLNEDVWETGWITLTKREQDEVEVFAHKDTKEPLYYEQQETMGFCSHTSSGLVDPAIGGTFPQHGVCKYIPLYQKPPSDSNDYKELENALTVADIDGKPDAIEIVSDRPEECVIRRVLIRTFPMDKPPTTNMKPEPPRCYETLKSPVDLVKTGSVEDYKIEIKKTCAKLPAEANRINDWVTECGTDTEKWREVYLKLCNENNLPPNRLIAEAGGPKGGDSVWL